MSKLQWPPASHGYRIHKELHTNRQESSYTNTSMKSATCRKCQKGRNRDAHSLPRRCPHRLFRKFWLSLHPWLHYGPEVRRRTSALPPGKSVVAPRSGSFRHTMANWNESRRRLVWNIIYVVVSINCLSCAISCMHDETTPASAS